MPLLSRMMSFWRNLFRRKQVEQDLDDELQAYAEEMAARGAELTELGDIDRIKNLVRQQRVGFRDLRDTGVTVVIAIFAFVTGAGTAVGAMRWNAPVAEQPERNLTSGEPLQGRLVDEETGAPIPRAIVGLQPFPTSRRETLTDDNGYFTFRGPIDPSYVLEAGGREWLFRERHSTSNDSRGRRVFILNGRGEPDTTKRIRLFQGTIVVTSEGKEFPVLTRNPSGALELAADAERVKRIQYDEGPR